MKGNDLSQIASILSDLGVNSSNIGDISEIAMQFLGGLMKNRSNSKRSLSQRFREKIAVDRSVEGENMKGIKEKLDRENTKFKVGKDSKKVEKQNRKRAKSSVKKNYDE